MQRTSRLIIFGLGLVISAFFYPESFAQRDWNLKAPKMLEDEEILKQVQPLENTKQKEEPLRPKVEYGAQGLRDPFLPLITEKKTEGASLSQQIEVKSLPALTVQGLIWGGAFPQAIINNKVVKVGDTIGEVKIIEISKEGVTVLFANREHKLSSPAATK